MRMRNSLAILLVAGGMLLGANLDTLGQEFDIPEPIRTEHEELHARIEAAMQAGGRTGKAAKAVSDALTPHFEKEEKYALPQLGVTSRLVGVTPAPKEPKLSRQEREDLITRTDRFREELPKMLEEHKAIGAAVEKLQRAAEAEKKPEQIALAEQIRQHAKTEEQILYPAALLIGEYARLQAGSAP